MCLPLVRHLFGAHVVCFIAFLPHNGHISGLVAFGDAQGAVEGVDAATMDVLAEDLRQVGVL